MEQGSSVSPVSRIGFIGNYLPRQCGIATFTTDLCEAVATEFPGATCIALPVNDIAAGYDYPSRVRFELTEKDIESYRRAADFLNINNVDLVCLQHEYGIFGGRAGSHILALLRDLRMPIVTTFHTILRDPDPDQLRVLQEVAALSDRVVVMSERGVGYLQRFSGDRLASQVREELAGRLLTLYQNNRAENWLWFEDRLTYCNAALPHAMILCGHTMSNPLMTGAGLEALGWLADLQRSDGEGHPFVPIGSNGFYQKGGDRARFDQQPVEAQAMISACLEAHRATGDKRWRKEARRAFEWFLGRNDLNLPIYDPTTGGCRDGLHPDRLNENQGAESTLAFLQSLLELRLAESAFTSKEVRTA